MAADAKILPLHELDRRLADARAAGKRVVLCHGVFDLMHPGHILHFKAARALGDVLVVTITPDRFVNKGPGRPVFGQRLRAETIAALEYVDHVAINEWPTAVETIALLRPHVYAKGSDYADASRDLTGKIRDEERAVQAVGGTIVFTDEESFSSSHLLNRFFSTLPSATDAYLREFRARHSRQEILDAIDGLADLRVLVIGEAILDEYCYCVPLGKAPKDTMIATRYVSEERFAGGALAVANHVAAFCSGVTLLTTLGTDVNEREFINLKLGTNVELSAVATPDRPTVVKRRYVDSTFLAKLFEVQSLDDRPLPPDAEARFLEALGRRMAEHDLVVVADFGHGLMTDAIRAYLSASKKFVAVNTQTNSANLGFNPATRYDRASYLCLHEGELKLALRTQYGELKALASRLKKDVQASTVLVTRGPNGAFLVGDDGAVHESPALSIRAVDRTGAGDAVFAVTAPCVYRGFAPDLVPFIGNCAGALAVEIVCNREPVTPAALKKFITHILI